jgi:hypothetical protein
LRVFGPNPPPHLAFRERTAPPTTTITRTHHRTTHTHRPPPPFHMARPQPSHGSSVAGFGPTPHPRPAFHERTAPHHHHHLVGTTVPPLCTISRRCFTRRARNRATAARLLVLAQPPTSRFASAQPHPTTTTTTILYALSYPPSPTAVPHGAPSTEPRRVLAQTPPLRVSRAHSPTTTTITLYVPPCHPMHHPPPPFHTARPKSSPSGLVLGS